MSQILTCGHCASKLRLPDGFNGTQVKCSTCGNGVAVPPPGLAPQAGPHGAAPAAALKRSTPDNAGPQPTPGPVPEPRASQSSTSPAPGGSAASSPAGRRSLWQVGGGVVLAGAVLLGFFVWKATRGTTGSP